MTPPLPTSPPSPTFREMLEEVMDLGGGLAIIALPLFVLSVPGIALFFIAPMILLLAVALPLALVAAVIGGPPYLLARRLRR